MKKIIAFLLSLSLVFCLAACTTPVTDDTQKPNEGKQPVADSFSFTHNGTKIALHAPMADILTGLGEPKSYSESASCAFDGLDKTYDYGSFIIQTYPLDGKDYVYMFWFNDDLVTNDEGICITSTLAEVQAAYGTEGYNGSNAYTITKGSGQLIIILENDAVSSIQYVITAE